MNQLFVRYRRWRALRVPIVYPDPISRHFSAYKAPMKTSDMMVWVIILGIIAALFVVFPIDPNAVFGWR